MRNTLQSLLLVAVGTVMFGLGPGPAESVLSRSESRDSGQDTVFTQATVNPHAAAPASDYFRSPDFTEPMLAVELQYYRVPKEKWELMLRRMAQYHANTISTYVCWAWHEYEEGKFDFTGETIPERDLLGFIELVQKHGLRLVLKPGPFIDAELNAGGIPRWLIQKYPETIARRPDGKPYLHGDSNLPRLSYLHPKYLERTGIYYQELGKAVARFQWPQGPIVAVQVDNETPGDGFISADNYLKYNFKADYNEYYMKTAWPEWLRQKYGTIAALNSAYGSSYSEFEEVPLPRKWGHPRNAKEFQIYLDLDRFGEWQYVEGLRRMTALLRQAGFSVPAFQDLLCMPWDLSGALGDVGGMAEAVGGWIGNNIYAEVYRLWSIFVGNLAYKYNWDEYVHMAVWRMKLTASLSEPYPALVPEISCSQRFYFQAPIAWNAAAVNIYVGLQTKPDNPLLSPHQAWGMEACVTPAGEIRDCFWNGKNTYLFMAYAGAFTPRHERPEVAIVYTHEPEHAWNWEFKFNLNQPHSRPRHKHLADITEGTNTSERDQLIAWDLVRQDIDFDVLHLDHLKPGQLERYPLLLIPSLPSGALPDPGVKVQEVNGQYRRFVAVGERELDLSEFERRGIKLRLAWAESPEVDVMERVEPTSGRVVVSIVNRSAREFHDQVFFRGGREKLLARVGKKAIGFAAVREGHLFACVIDHEKGRGEYRYGEDRMAFTGSFATVVWGDKFVLVSAPDKGAVTITSPRLLKPEKLIRLGFNGRIQEHPFDFRDQTLHFEFDPGPEGDRTDLYIALFPGVSLEQAIGPYLGRTAK